MNPYVNTAAGALLSTVFVLMTVSLAADGIFHAPAPAAPGFAIAAADGGDASAAAAPVAAVPVAQLLASADAAAGANVFKKCQSCHVIDSGGANKVGPALWGIIGRPIATHEGFNYSAALKTFSAEGSETWTFEHLNDFLRAPKTFIKGTSMGFAGLRNDAERASLIAWLREQSDAPLPLPEPEAAPAAEPPATN